MDRYNAFLGTCLLEFLLLKHWCKYTPLKFGELVVMCPLITAGLHD